MKKIAIFLPHGYRGGTLRAAKNIAKALKYHSAKERFPLEVIFSCLEDCYDLESDFEDLYKYDIKVRETCWKEHSKDEILKISGFFKKETSSIDGEYFLIPYDGMNNFLDCDFWLLISVRYSSPIYPFKRYGTVVYDYIQRYVPEIFDDEFWDEKQIEMLRVINNAEFVIGTTPSTINDIVTYAGVQRKNTFLAKMDFSFIDNVDRNETQIDNYFIWVTNTTQHKNHERAIKALSLYYERYLGKLDVYVTGYLTDLFDPKNKEKTPYEYINKVRDLVSKEPILKDRIRFMGNVSDVEYANLVRNAKFLWHTNVYDNGTFSVIEAASLKTPSLSARYPAMEYIDKEFKLNLRFFDPFSVIDMAKELSRMEKEYEKIELPSRDFLQTLNWKNNSSELYYFIKQFLLSS